MAFEVLKNELTQAPVLVHPEFQASSAPFYLLTDASGVGIGAVLEQAGHVVAYANRVLTQAERNYSVIQRECLAVVYGMKQFRHYLLGCPFSVLTDHAPLQWLSAQKMFSSGQGASWQGGHWLSKSTILPLTIRMEARITMLMHCLECLSLRVTKSMPCKRALLRKVNIVQPPLAVLARRQTFSSSSSSTMICSSANYMRNCLRVEQNITSTGSCLAAATVTPLSPSFVPAHSQRWCDMP